MAIGPAPHAAKRAAVGILSSKLICAATPERAKSPCRRAISTNAAPELSGIFGTMISVNISSGSKAVVRISWKKLWEAIRRSPRTLCATKVNSSARATAGYSAAGSAFARLPPIVPRLRIGK